MFKNFIFAIISILLLNGSINAQGYKVLESTDDHVIISFDFSNFGSIKDTVISGRTISRFQDEEMYFMTDGYPRIPEFFVSLGIPASSDATVEVVSMDRKLVKTAFVLPFTLSDSTILDISNLYYEKSVYNKNALYPENLARIEGKYSFRFANVQPVIVSPFQYNPVTKEIFKTTKLVLKVKLKSVQGNQILVSTPVNDEATESFLKSTVLNYDQAKKWISETKDLRDAGSLSSTNWYNPDKQYFKLYLNKSDVFKLTYDQLVAAGMPTDRNIRVEKLQIFSTEGEIPLAVMSGNSRFSSGDYIIFVGDSVPASPYTMQNLYNKSNIFWFSYEADTSGLRYISKTGYPTVSQPEVNTVKASVRWESDQIYERLGWAPNEKRDYWYWQKLTAKNYQPEIAIAHRFDAPVNISSDIRYFRVRVNLHGLTTTVVPCNFVHSVKFYLNGKLIGKRKWNGQESFTFDSTYQSVNDSILIVFQGNVLRVELDGDVCTVGGSDEVRLNWIEFEYYKMNRTHGNHYFFKSPDGYNTNVRYYMWQWTSPTMHVYVPSKNVVYVNNLVTGPPAGLALFQDSVYQPSEYFAVDSLYGKSVDSIRVDTPSRLRDITNGADYIIITHPKFRSVAERLATYRSSRPIGDGTTPPRVYIADVLEIYDEFSHGLMDPFAIRDFLAFAFTSFARPAPLYVTLIGDMSYDYRKILPDSRENYIPSIPFHSYQYGQSASDNGFVAVTGSGVTPDMALSRISIETVEEGMTFLDKLEAYPADNGKKWRETVMLLSSGIDAGDELQFGFNRESLKLKQNFLDPLGYDASVVIRFPNTPSELPYQGSTPEIKAAFDKGASLANYYGHGGGYQWDLTFLNNDIYTLNNAGRMPLIISVTCYTAHFDNQDVFGEQFLKIPNKGAIGFFGSSGLTLWQIGTYYNSLFFDEVFNLKNTISGKAILASKVRTPPVGYYINQIALLTYLGEPGLDIVLPKKPDFVLENSDLKFLTTNPLVDDTVKIKLTMSNFGIRTNDSVTVKLRFSSQDTSGVVATIRIPGFGNNDSTEFTWIPKKSGLITLTAEINEDNLVPEDDHSDNIASSVIAVFNISDPSIISPEDGFTSQTTPEIKISDIGYYINRNFSYQVEFDTSFSFVSPLVNSGNLTGTDGLLTYKNNTLNPGRFFWRSRIVDGNNLGRWSSTRTFNTVDPPVEGFTYSGTQLRLFETENVNFSNQLNGLFLNTSLNIPKPQLPRLKYKLDLKNVAELQNIAFNCITSDGTYYYLADYWFSAYQNNPEGKTEIHIVGTGNNGTTQGEYYGAVPNFFEQIRLQFATIKDKIYIPQESPAYLLRVTPSTGEMDTVMIPDSLIDLETATVKNGKFLISSQGSKLYNLAVKNLQGKDVYALRVFESENNFALEREYIYPLLESYPDVWIGGFFVVDDILYVGENYSSGFMSAFRISDGKYIGEWNTVPIGSGLPKQFSSWYYDDTRDEVVAANYIRGSSLVKGIAVFSGYYFDAQGKVASTEVGPVRDWRNFSYDIVGGSASATFTASLAGFNNQTLKWDTLAVNVASPYTLNQVDEAVYSKLKAFFTFTDSSLSSTNPIYLKKVAFEAATGLPEITISNNDFSFTPDSLMQGFDINIDLKVTNVGKVDSDSCTVQFYLGAANEPFYTTKIKIPADTFYTVKHTINTSKMVFHNKVKAVVTMDGTEMFTFNNLGADSFYVARDTIKPDFKLTFDGKEIINGDIIANSPLIEITLTDNSPLPLDTTRLSIVHNGKPIGFVKDSVHFSYTPYPNSKLYVSWKPVFKEGKQTLEVFTKDASDIPYSSVAQKYQFFVFDKDAIERIYNYPNPFTDETWFTYELRGNTLPDEVKIKIFTIAGRLIKEIDIPSASMQIGLNKIYWDGRDADGDEIANGVYLYKLITKYKDKTKTTIEKIAKVK